MTVPGVDEPDEGGIEPEFASEPGLDTRQLVIVATGHSGLFEHLRAALAFDRKTTVVMDRRQSDAALPAGWERRRAITPERDLRSRPVIVVRERCTSSEEGEQEMSNVEVPVATDRERVERWVEDSQYVIGRLIPGLLEDRDRWRLKAEAAEQEVDRLRLEIGAMRKELAERETERQYIRAEQVALADAFHRAMEHFAQMQNPLGDVLQRLHALQPVLVENSSH